MTAGFLSCGDLAGRLIQTQSSRQVSLPLSSLTSIKIRKFCKIPGTVSGALKKELTKLDV
jgi:hypothetical protein